MSLALALRTAALRSCVQSPPAANGCAERRCADPALRRLGGTATFVKAPRCERMTAHGACSAPPQPSAGANRAWRPRVAQCGMACVRRNYIVGIASDLSRRGSRDADDIGARGAPTTPDPALDSGPP